MRSIMQSGRRPAALLIAIVAPIVLGVLAMHSVVPVAASHAMGDLSASSEHRHMSEHRMSEHRMSEHQMLRPDASGGHDCPSTHQMMHPCAGTVTSWPALDVASGAVDLAPLPKRSDGIDARADSTLERAPPWTLWSFDRSAISRV